MFDAIVAENTNEQDLFGAADPLVFEPGTVGWDDTGEHFDAGTADNDGNTLVRVTLFRGRDPSVAPKAGVASGHRILAQLGGGLFRIPPKGTRVMVGFPTAFATTPGAAVILCTCEASPDSQFGAGKAKLDVGPDQEIILKGKAVTLTDYDDRFLHVGPDGVMMQDENGNGVVIKNGAIVIYVADGGDAKSVIQITKGELSFLQKDSGFVKLKSGSATVFANKSAAIVAGNVMLGAQASPATPALTGITAPTAKPSTSVFVSL
jgi:hypothetical protein